MVLRAYPGKAWFGTFVAIIALSIASARAAEPVADFKLKNFNSNSPRGTNLVSPRDYLQQVSGYYFFMASCTYCRSQLEYLQTLQNELRSAGTALNIEILGINETGYESVIYVPVVTLGRNLAMVQDTTEARVRLNWNAEVRDVVILDSSNRVAGVFNLTAQNLAEPENRAALKQMFLNAAALADSDADGLPDHWELQALQTLAQGPEDDPDGDRANNYFEFAFGTDPKSRWSRPKVETGINDSSRFTVRFTRWAGTLANYRIEGTVDLGTWSEGGLRTTSRNLFDGTGRCEMSYSFDKSVVTQPFGFLRVSAEPLP